MASGDAGRDARRHHQGLRESQLAPGLRMTAAAPIFDLSVSRAQDR